MKYVVKIQKDSGINLSTEGFCVCQDWSEPKHCELLLLDRLASKRPVNCFMLHVML